MPAERPADPAAGFAAAGFQGGSDFFPAPRSTYNGLIAPYGDVVPERSGYFQISVSTHGYFSGRFSVAGDSIPLRGWFNSHGQGGVSVYRRVWDDCHCFTELILAWTVQLNLVADSDEIEGTVVNERRGGWETTLYGLRAGYATTHDAAPQSGRYTLRLPGAVDPMTAPPGDGAAQVTVNARGGVTLNGVLPEGTKISDSAYLSVDGYWPLYVPLSDGHGLLLGWLHFEGGQITGDLTWHKPARDRTYYPAGFAGTISARGGTYSVARGAVSPFQWTQGRLQATDGNLAGPAGNDVAFRSASAVTVDAGGDLAGLKLAVNARTGWFSGKFVHPITGRKTAYAGAVFQFVDAGGGYFLGTDLGGTITLTAAGEGR